MSKLCLNCIYLWDRIDPTVECMQSNFPPIPLEDLCTATRLRSVLERAETCTDYNPVNALTEDKE